ncbi:TlpA family protein disulfide reductase [Planctomycetota bacterium]
MKRWILQQLVVLELVLACLLMSGCGKQPSMQEEKTQPAPVASPTDPVATALSGDFSQNTLDVSGIAGDSSLDVNDQDPVPLLEAKRLWAKSFLWEKPPELIVEQWLSETPQTRGKCVLLEFWATWCPPCRKSIHLLNKLHERFQDRLVVIGLSGESEQAVRNLHQPQIHYYSAIDTQERTKNALGVEGIPHVIILEPEGYVVWEGFPYQKGYELTEEVVASILDIAFPNAP